MKTVQGWECTARHCGAYNGVDRACCHRCQAPQDSGRPIYYQIPVSAPIPPKAPRPASPSSPWEQVFGDPPQFWRMACLFLVITFVPWYLQILGAFFGLLIWIGIGVWKLVNQSGRPRQ